MKLKITKNDTVDIVGLTLDQANAIIRITTNANERCFREEDKQENGDTIREMILFASLQRTKE